MKKHKCSFAECDYKHLSLLCVLDHMFKDHKLRINGRRIYLKSMTSETLNDASKQEGVKDE